MDKSSFIKNWRRAMKGGSMSDIYGLCERSMGTDVSDFLMGNGGSKECWVEKNVPLLKDLLSGQAGRMAEVTFVMPGGGTETKSGRLMGVGKDYIVLGDPDGLGYTACAAGGLVFARILY